MKKITYEQATNVLTDFAMECDLDELAHIFGVVFGYDVIIDVNEDFVCTPNKDCGFILEQPGGRHYVAFSDN